MLDEFTYAGWRSDFGERQLQVWNYRVRRLTCLNLAIKDIVITLLECKSAPIKPAEVAVIRENIKRIVLCIITELKLQSREGFRFKSTEIIGLVHGNENCPKSLCHIRHIFLLLFDGQTSQIGAESGSEMGGMEEKLEDAVCEASLAVVY